MNAQHEGSISGHEHAIEELPIEHEHHHENGSALSDIPFTASNMPRLAGLVLIRLYQVTLSKILPPGSCRFYPTCSHYGYQAIAKHGLVKGSGLAVWRVARCQPFSEGGYDPVP